MLEQTTNAPLRGYGRSLVAKEVLKGNNKNDVAKRYEKAMHEYVDSYHDYINECKKATNSTLTKFRDTKINNPRPTSHSIINDTEASTAGERYVQKLLASNNSDTLVIRSELIDLYEEKYNKRSYDDYYDFKHTKR